MRPPEEGELAKSAAKQVRLSKFCMNNDQSPWSVDLAGDNTFCLVGMISHYGVATHSVHYSPPCTASTRTAGCTTTTAGSAAWTSMTSWGMATRKTATSSFTCTKISARATAEMCRGTAQRGAIWRSYAVRVPYCMRLAVRPSVAAHTYVPVHPQSVCNKFPVCLSVFNFFSCLLMYLA